MANGYWFVARTKPKCERWAAENVVRQGFDLYLPVTEVGPEQGKKPVRKGFHLAPPDLAKVPPQGSVYLFPGYLFIFTLGRWHSLLNTFGIRSLIMNGQRPAIMPESEIENIRARENMAGVIELPSLKEFRAGDAVCIKNGIFSGSRGIYAGDSSQQRVKVLLDFMGRGTPVVIERADVELV